MLGKLNKAQKGFTLIELLIVIAILGILAAVAIPSLKSFITSGKISAANSEVSTAQIAQEAYASENNGVFAANSSSLAIYTSTPLAATYTYDTTTGKVLTADCTATSWGTSIDFSLSKQQWIRGTTGKSIP